MTPALTYRLFLLSLLIALVAVDTRSEDAITPRQLEFFETRIRPVLVEHCYGCHNSIENAEAGLAVDHRQGLLDADDILIPGNVAASRLIAILKHDVDGLEMPEDGARLDDEVIRDFEKWIEMGAPDPRDEPPSASQLAELTSWESTLERRKQWWSFQPIQSVNIPAGEAAHPVDRFVDAKLLENGLHRTPPADPTILIRRLFITLTGLPPNPEQVRIWSEALADDRPSATADLIEQLLNSPQFGERWARHWMDWIRYAESHGSEGDPRIDNAWRYRDYLIRAWNEDVPYDQLVREHVAGDLLESPRVNRQLGINESMIGTTHWRMVFHGFAPTDALDEKVRFVDDQINAFSKAFLGLTVSCARCHDHKFDAISQADYYALFGVLGSCRPARKVIDLPARQNLNKQALSALKPKVKNAVIQHWQRNGFEDLRNRLLDIKEDSSEFANDPLVKPLIEANRLATQSTASAKLIRAHWTKVAESVRDDGGPDSGAVDVRWNASGDSGLRQWYRQGLGLDAPTSKAGEFSIAVSGERVLEHIFPTGVYSNKLTAKHAARLTSPDHLIQPGQHLWVRALGDGEAAVRYVIQDYPRNGTVFPVRSLTPTWTWHKFDLSYWAGDSMHVELAAARDAPLLVKGSGRSWFGISDAVIMERGASRKALDGALRAIVRGATEPDSIDDWVDAYVISITDAVDAWRSESLSDDQALLLDRCIRIGWLSNQAEQMSGVEKLLSEYRDLEADIPEPIRVPGLDETVGRQQPLFVRGDHKRPGELVPRRFLEAIDDAAYETKQSGRRELAENLIADNNPLTRRVIVNRLWHHLFGRGMVETPDNFGRLGAKPSHPALLDWLSNQLVAEDWSMKAMIRLMVSSETWQQSSHPSDDAKRLDPDNRWLSHANVRRMEAEVIRDSLLVASGRLDTDSLFGPPVGGGANRRSVYLPVIRNSLDPFLRAFDFPEPFSATGRREATNVPAQSLTMMNAKQVTQVAADLARRLLEDATLQSDEDRIQVLFQRLFSRIPTVSERQLYQQYVQRVRRQYADDARQRQQLQQDLQQQRKLARAILNPVRKRLSDRRNASRSTETLLPDPLARWTFDENLNDAIGGLHGTPRGAVTVDDGVLTLRSGGYVVTERLTQPLAEKTLEAWVRLDNLNQRGGGVMTVQSADGSVFDAIVYGEQQAKHWLSGSEFFRRTRPFEGEAESDASEQFVYIAIVYHADGRVSGYRQGQPYGTSYQTAGLNRFAAKDTMIGFGIRHLPAGGNRMLSGQIDEARLYPRALTDAEVEASFSSGPGAVTRRQVLAELSAAVLSRLTEIETRIQQLESEIQSLSKSSPGSVESLVWTDLAHASLMMKEFIYVQ